MYLGLFGFARVEGRAVVVAFDGGAIICPLSPRLMASNAAVRTAETKLRTERPEGGSHRTRQGLAVFPWRSLRGCRIPYFFRTDLFDLAPLFKSLI